MTGPLDSLQLHAGRPPRPAVVLSPEASLLVRPRPGLLPAVLLPPVLLPLVPLPAVLLPPVPLPAVPLPAVPLPAVPLPAVPLPAVPLPAAPLPAVLLPAAPLPAVPLPAVPLPAVLLPAVLLPAALLPAVLLPAVPLPAVPLPAVPLPAVPLPAVPLPVVLLPAVLLPAVPLPAVPLPAVRPPSARSRPAPLPDGRRPAAPPPAVSDCRCASCLEESRLAGSAARSPASWSIRVRAASPGSGSGGIAVSGIETLGNGAMTGGGIAGVAGTAHVASSVGATAITAGGGIGAGAVSLGRSARKGTCAGAAPVAARVLGLAFALVVASGMIGAAVCRGVGARDTDAVGAGPLATGCSTDACCDGSATGMSVGSGAVTCGGTTTTRRSGASMRRSCQGKPKPGRHNPWPPKIRLNRNEWISSESSSAYVSRLCSGLMCWLSARRWNLWSSSVLRRSCSGTAAGAGQDGTMSCAPVDLTGPLMTSPKQHLRDIREPHPVHCHMHSCQTWASILTCPNEPSTGERHCALNLRADKPLDRI